MYRVSHSLLLFPASYSETDPTAMILPPYRGYYVCRYRQQLIAVPASVRHFQLEEAFDDADARCIVADRVEELRTLIDQQLAGSGP
jgi:hypothetical protein